MSEGNVSRRDLLRGAALALAAGNTLSAQMAQHVHHEVAEQKQASGGPYQPKAFTPHEYQTLTRLCDMIIPADDRSPGALAGGAPEFIDLLSSQNADLAATYTGGLGWLDSEMQRRYGTLFSDGKTGQQAALLDLIAYRKNDSPGLGPGIRFFQWVRRMTVDAYYTSKVGVADLGYQGNAALPAFTVPQEALDYVLKRSGL